MSYNKQCFTDSIQCKNASNDIEGMHEIINNAIKELNKLEDNGNIIYQLDIKVQFKQNRFPDKQEEEPLVVEKPIPRSRIIVDDDFRTMLDSYYNNRYMNQAKFDTFTLLFAEYYNVIRKDRPIMLVSDNYKYNDLNDILKDLHLYYRIKCIKSGYEKYYKLIGLAEVYGYKK